MSEPDYTALAERLAEFKWSDSTISEEAAAAIRDLQKRLAHAECQWEREAKEATHQALDKADAEARALAAERQRGEAVEVLRPFVTTWDRLAEEDSLDRDHWREIYSTVEAARAILAKLEPKS